MQTLVLDAGFQPVDIISGFDALVKIISGKAEAIVNYDEVVRSVSLTFKLPKVIKLKRIVKAIKKATQVAYSKRNLLVRDDCTCQYCSKKLTIKTATVDHVLPKSRGGKNTWQNTVIACGRCNNKKDCKTPEEANMRLLRIPEKPRIMNIIRNELRKEMEELMKSAYLEY